MALSSPYAALTVRYVWLGQQCQTKREFSVSGMTVGSTSALDLAVGFWDDFKSVWRALVESTAGTVFSSVLCEELGGGREFAEYSIPALERVGTRSITTATQPIASFNAAGARLTVGTRVTRPGQMRVPFLYETDVGSNVIDTPFLTLFGALAAAYSSPRTLASPADGVTITPLVVGASDPTTEVPTRFQPIVGYVLNGNITSQVSRKMGRGS